MFGRWHLGDFFSDKLKNEKKWHLDDNHLLSYFINQTYDLKKSNLNQSPFLTIDWSMTSSWLFFQISWKKWKKWHLDDNHLLSYFKTKSMIFNKSNLKKSHFLTIVWSMSPRWIFFWFSSRWEVGVTDQKWGILVW